MILILHTKLVEQIIFQIYIDGIKLSTKAKYCIKTSYVLKLSREVFKVGATLKIESLKLLLWIAVCTNRNYSH